MYDLISGILPSLLKTGNRISNIESLFFGLSKMRKTIKIPNSLAFATARSTTYKWNKNDIIFSFYIKGYPLVGEGRGDCRDFPINKNPSSKMLHMGNHAHYDFKLFLLFLFAVLITTGLSFIPRFSKGNRIFLKRAKL